RAGAATDASGSAQLSEGALKPGGRGAEADGVRTPARIALLIALVSTLAWTPAPADAATLEGMLAGIDVSHWQGSINWAKVGGDGVSFAIMKATEGRSYVDPTYSTNVDGATSNGIAVGAYHFAGPSSQQGDAVAEADHFVSVARNAAGDVLPALD